ncbi:MAG: LytR C-terminal domain-containing protein [Balneola sp.]|nr:LytR C-terminal domain-containing protein [Balneola sp.]MBO6652162.1 LytR C-terminal domain-containing protein [Balneola sp.]MBO6712749.1 LytR C-terminal domain-containing protein [Balneola sp.]MBO6801560.1 LytR C-terminal domain-containing protein [Balneola sp.]MBO6871922.1 LytR C-terminal domain-containing protein [Balneola sp.]
MAQNQDEKTSSNSNLYLNSVIGFLSVLLLGLLLALFTRIVYPRIFNQRADQPSQLIGSIIQLEVLNGCGESGIANNFTNLLRSNGFDVVEVGNFERFDVENTFVISRSSSFNNAKRVADALGVSEENIIREESEDFYLDVTVVLGKDYQQLNTN